MNYVESIKNWLLGNSEIDKYCPSVPPYDNPEQLLELYKQAKQPVDKDKIEKKLGKMGYEVKTLYILSRK